MSERKPEQRCAKCGEERTARGGDLHCYADCDWFGHGEPGNCHPFVLPTDSETERCAYTDLPHTLGLTTHGPAIHSRGGYMVCEKCYRAILAAERAEESAYTSSPAPSETPSPEVGMRFTEVRYGRKSVDRLCVDCGDRFYLFADAMLFSSRPVNWPNEIGWRCSTCTTLATVAAAKEQSK